MAELITIMLGSLFRMLLLGAFGALIQRGVFTEDQVGQLAVGLAGFVSVVAWALWKRYHDRLKFLTALESPPGTTEAAVKAKVSEGMGAKVLALVLAVALGAGLVTGCAKGTPRHQAAVASQEIGAALFALDDGERALYTAGRISPAQHKAISGKLVDVLTLGRDINAAILAWRPGQPAPKVLRDILPALQRLTLDVVQMLPGQPGADVLALINAVYAAVAVVLAVMV